MKCHICEIGCKPAHGESGRCRMYENREGTLVERFPFTYMTAIPISIETMPMTHFRPRAKFLQLGGVGCNFSCKGCVSDLFTHHMERFAGALSPLNPEDIIGKARAMKCEGIVWCMNDPTVLHPSFLALARAAKTDSLLVGCSSNMYHTQSAATELAEVIDFVNCGLKGGTDSAYRRCGVPSAEPVFRNIGLLHDAGVHTEVSLMYDRGNESEVLIAAEKLAAVSGDLPFQIMRFLPFGDASMDQEPTLMEAENLCEEVRRILPYTYLFNTPGTSYLHTSCPKCHTPLIYREFYGPMGCRVMSCRPEATCPCGHQVPVVKPVGKKAYEEFGMNGGYRFTRGLEIIRALCECLGITSDAEISDVWCSVIANDDVNKLHDKINRIGAWLDLIEEMGKRFGKTKRAKALRSYLQELVTRVFRAVCDRSRPRVYYAMTTPFFALNGERFEIELATCAGSECVNRSLTRSGKPGINISREELLHLDPEYILISGLFSSSVEEFGKTCRKNGIWVDAVNRDRIYAIPPGWDFGNPRWILGLMLIANILHPDCCHFDLQEETERFYEIFYQTKPEHFITNRSFYQQPLLASSPAIQGTP